MRRSMNVFLVCGGIWEIVVGVVYGLFIRYVPQTTVDSMQNSSTSYSYYYASNKTSNTTYNINSTASPFPQMVLALAIILLIVGNS